MTLIVQVDMPPWNKPNRKEGPCPHCGEQMSVRERSLGLCDKCRMISDREIIDGPIDPPNQTDHTGG